MFSDKYLTRSGPTCSTGSLSAFACLVLLLTTIPPLRSQDYYSTRSVVVEDLIEKIARESEQELDYLTLFSDIYRHLETPLNLNTASREELEKLQLLSDFQILSLQQYIRENGPLLSIYELPLVYGFDESLARILEPLVILETPDRSPKGPPKSSHQLLIKVASVLEKQEGYAEIPDSALEANPNARYLGNPLRITTRYRYRWGDKLAFGYNGDKDPGEPFFSGENRQGFDFNSVYFQANDVWKFKRIQAGDYQVRAGQGLSLWSGLAFGKSPDIVNLRKKGDALAPYTSIDENRFMRGIAGTVGLGNLDITGFFSHKRIDANIVGDTLEDRDTFSSFQRTGYHRTPGEFNDKDAVRETVAGGNIAWNHRQFKIGASFLHYFFDTEYERLWQGGSPPALNGNSNSNLGVDYLLVLKRVSLFGEFSSSLNTGTGNWWERLAVLNGASFELHPRVSMSLLQRYMGAGFTALYGNAFRENSVNSNENGIYMGVEIRPFPHWRLTGYLDAYRFPYLARLFASEHSGFDYHLQADYADRDRLSGYLRYRYKRKPENINGDTAPVPGTPIPQGSQFRLHISYRISDALTFQDRLELSHYEKEEKESGWLAYHDILYKPATLPLSFSFRYAMFDTESWASRIYTYEHDVLYAFAIPSYYGRGIRTYLNARWTIGRHIDLWFKYALSWYPDRETISSGLNEIQGHHRQDVNVQLRVKF